MGATTERDQAVLAEQQKVAEHNAGISASAAVHAIVLAADPPLSPSPHSAKWMEHGANG